MTPASPASRVKGALLEARIDLVRRRGGEPALEKVLSRLPKEDQQVLRGLVVRVAWYPLELLLRLDEAMAGVLSPGDAGSLYREMGRSSAELNLRGPQAPFVREGDPHYVLRHAPQIYSAYHDRGRRTYEQTGPRSAVLRTFEAREVDAKDCLTAVGWIERALEISGAREPKVTETLCRARGDPHCEYRCEWS